MGELFLPLPRMRYRFDLLLAIVRRNATPARMVVRGDVLWRYTGGMLLSYRQVGDGILVQGSGLRAESHARIGALSRRALGLDADLRKFYAYARGDSALWRVVGPLVGMPMFCTETVFEALVSLITEQHITWKTALRSQRTLLRMFGDGGDMGVYDFPAPSQLAVLGREGLRALKITNGRIDCILRIARGIRDGLLELESLRGMESAEAYACLLGVKGVGPWTANNALGRAFGSYPRVSHRDVALQSAVNHYFCGGDGDKSAGQTLETLGRYDAYAGLVGHFVLLRWVLDRYPLGH